MKRNDCLPLPPHPTIVVNEPNWLGDVLFSIPVLRSLKHHLPDARLVLLAPAYLAPLFAMLPEGDEVVSLRRLKPSPGELAVIWNRLRRRRPDAALMLQGSSTRAFVIRAAGTRWVIGRRRPDKRPVGMTHLVDTSSAVHRRDVYAAVLKPLGCPLSEGTYRLEPPERMLHDHRRHFHRRYALRPREYMVIHAGGNWERKRWPVDRLIGLARQQKRRGWPRAVLIGTEREKPTARCIQQAVPDVVDLCGETSLEQLAVILKDARLVLSGDSGPLHLAAALGTPVVGLYGPTHPRHTGPIGPEAARVLFKDVGCNRSACYDPTCPAPQCLLAVSEASITEAVEALLASPLNEKPMNGPVS